MTQRLVLMGLAVTLLATCTASRGRVASELSPQSKEFLRRPVATYGGAASQPWASQPEGHVGRQWVGTMPPETQGRTHHDATMDALAHVVAIEAATHQRAPAYQLRAWLAWKVGVGLPDTACHVSWSRSEQARGVPDLDAARANSAQLLQDSTREAFAAAAMKLTGPRDFALGAALVQVTQPRSVSHALALCWAGAHASTSPIPKLHPASNAFTVKGRACAGCTVRGRMETNAPTASWTSGTVEPDGAFAVPFTTAAVPGVFFLQVQVRGPDAGNWRDALMVPLYVGVPEPEGMSPQDEALLLDQRPAQEWNASMVDALNAWRAAHNRAALQPNPGLALLARARLGGDEKAGGLGAKVPGKVVVTGWSSIFARSAGEALWALTHDAGARRTLMATDATHVGIAFEPRNAGYRFMVILGGPRVRRDQKNAGDAGVAPGKPFRVSALVHARDGGGIILGGLDAGVDAGAE